MWGISKVNMMEVVLGWRNGEGHKNLFLANVNLGQSNDLFLLLSFSFDYLIEF
jgi:hypothetical protein